MRLRVAVRCDAGPRTGVGHLVRCVALAEEFAARGAQVTFLSNLGGLGWAREQVTGRGFRLLPGPNTPRAMCEAVRATGADLTIIDSYDLDPGCAGAVREIGVPVLAIVDGDLRGQAADIYLDQNLDADLLPVPLPLGARRLAGLRYVLLRDSVRRLRSPECPSTTAESSEPPRVLAFFGGTDAFGAGPVVARLLVATGQPFQATVVAGRPALAEQLREITPGPEQSMIVIDPTDDLPELAVRSDLVIGAAGTSVWEMLCLGAPTLLLWVVDNQRWGYHRVVARGLGEGLGRLADLAVDGGWAAAAVQRLGEYLARPLRRAELAARAWAAVDGRGRERVVDTAVWITLGASRSG